MQDDMIIEPIMGCNTFDGQRVILRLVKNGSRQLELATRQDSKVKVLASGKASILQKLEDLSENIDPSDLHALKWLTRATYVTA